MPDANIGIATGEESNLVVLDVDGGEGAALLAELQRANGPIPETMLVQTGNGRHVWLSYPRDVFKVPSVARDHLDVRGDGGYVVAPPSKHASGHTYSFVGNARRPAECPLWVVSYANGNLGGELSGPAIAGDSSAANRNKKTSEPATAPASTATPTPHNEKMERTVRSALASIPAHDRTVWRDVGMGLHSTGWDNAFLIWDDWSRTSPEKYDEADQRKTWESFDRPYDGSQITLGTIFHLAKQHGWQTQSSDAPGDDYRTDLGNTRRFVKRHGENIRYIYEMQKWIVWDDNHWKVDEDGAVTRLAKETIESIYTTALKLGDDPRRTELLKHAIKSQAEPRIFAIERMARSDAAVVLSVRSLDANPWLIGMQNGVVDLKTGQFRPGQREDYITKRARAIFDPNAQCAAWNAFVDTVTGHDANLKAYLQRMVGYAMTGSVREEVLFVLYGTGNNGKSTFREVVHALLGEYALASDASLLVERKTSGATPEIARLKGRRFVAVNETAENDLLNEARVKYITSQDTIAARHLHKEFFDFDPTHKTFVTTNHKPVVHGTDVGIWRRIHLIPFTIAVDKIVKIEKDFREARLLPELSGILNWAIEGAVVYSRDGLNPPATVLAATEDYRQDMDVVGQWLTDRCELQEHATVPTNVAYADYGQWAAREIGWALSPLKFRRNLTDRGFKGGKGTGGQRLIRGLELNPLNAPAMTAVAGGRPPGSW